MVEVSRWITLEVGEGNFDRGFAVVLRIGETGKSPSVEFRGRFPPAPDIPDLYDYWQQAYYRWGANCRWGRAARLNIPPQITSVSYWDECHEAARKLEIRLGQWFSHTGMWELREQIVVAVRPQEPARLFLHTQDLYLRKLPWHLWKLLERCPRLEIIISARHVQTTRQFHNPVRILAILGNSQEIDVKADQKMLEQLPNASVQVLEEPTRQMVSDRLFEQAWDVLFFAGHSRSEANGETGQLWMNETHCLTPDDLRYALQEAAQKGLQLAIFNSCDGLGLATQLDRSLGQSPATIPRLIVMREPVPDRVAQAFLSYFLKTFASGESFDLSVRKAREQLHGFEQDYPCASWLPVIYQNPAAPELKYPQSGWRKTVCIAAAGAIALGLLGSGFWLGRREFALRSRISQGEKLLVQSVTTPEKVAGVRAFWWKNHKEAEQHFAKSLQRFRNDPETLIYLNNARIGDRPALTIAVGVPIGSNANVAQEMLRGVAQAQDELNRQGGIAGKPLRVKIVNDDNNPVLVKDLVHRLVKDSSVLAVVGHNASDASVAAAPVYNEGGLTMLTPTSFSDKLSSNGPYVFRMVPNIRFMADQQVRYYARTNPNAKIAICSDSLAIDNESYRNHVANSILEMEINKPGIGLVPATCDFAAPDFDPKQAVNTLIQKKANTLLLAPHIDRIDRAIAVATANRGRMSLLASTSLHTGITLESGRKAVNGMLLAVPWYPNALPNDVFSQKATQLWGGAVTWRTAMSYDATRAIAAGLQQATNIDLQQRTTRTGLKDILRSPEFSINGATGKVRFIQSGERQIVREMGILIQVKPDPKSQFGYTFHPVP
jgi:branched-chain amino acid transport system substrate-binding protein